MDLLTAETFRQFGQAVKKPLSLSDFKEAFIQGMEFDDIYPDRDEEDKEVYCEVPQVLQKMTIPGMKPLDECVRLKKCIYGQKDAPRGWELQLFLVCTRIGLTQSLIDPALFVYYPTENEQKAITAGPACEEAYYREKLALMRKIPAVCVAERVRILDDGQTAGRVKQLQQAEDPQFLNQATVRIGRELFHHVQRPETPIGAMAVHVDDTVSSGWLIFYLRLAVLFERFTLSSWTVLEPGRRDAFVGREVVARPLVFDQLALVKEMAQTQAQREEQDFQPPAECFIAPSTEEVEHAEQVTGVRADVVVEDYPAAEQRKFDAALVPELNKLVVPVVYLFTQETYASKMQLVTREDVAKFMECRAATSSKFILKQLRNPFRGPVGEVAWLQKCNAVILQTFSDLASIVHLVEQETSPDSPLVASFLVDVNNLIRLARTPGWSTRRIFRLGDLGEHVPLGCGDAAQRRAAGGTHLFGPESSRVTTVSTFSKLPKRVFSSSTAVEVLAQRMLASEMIYLTTLLLDLHLTTTATPMIQLTDAQNALGEPHERNIRPDWESVQQLVEQRLLILRHIPGRLNFVDALTKLLRDSKPLALWMAVNRGVIDRRILELLRGLV
ncbi:unnamed protein product [Amoebophrya sp. A25]|nr:unnamed protein product [Amoebophrya sp. A25]|eukprot:GSA25T00019583001.1